MIYENYFLLLQQENKVPNPSTEPITASIRGIIYYIYIVKMESGLTMLMHSAIIGIILYIIMVYVLKQRQSVAENRSLILAAVTLIYMILFGHGLPTKINSDAF